MVNRKDTLAAISARFNVPLSTLDALDREMVKAGVRSHSRRGQNPPPMTAQDVIHIAFAATGKRPVKSAADEVAEITGLGLQGGVREMYSYDLVTQELESFPDGNKLTPTGILEGASMQIYPRWELPMATTFGKSLANVIERVPDTVALEDLAVIVRWPAMSAEIQFKLDIFGFRLFFGAVDYNGYSGFVSRLSRNEPVHSFKYSQGLLEWLGEVYRA